MSSVSPALAYRADIDGLRAIAVLAVVIFHAFPQVLPGGFVGVDVFFVISGYLISSIIFKALDGGTFSFADFYARRVRRIFPALVLVVLTSLLLGWAVLLPDEYAQLGKHAAAGLGFVANVAYWMESGYFDTAAELKPLLHLWSLGVEEQFYIVWPAVVLLLWRFGAGLWWTTAGLALVSFGISVWLSPVFPSASYFLPFSRAWELLAGAMLALAPRSRGGQSFVRPGLLQETLVGLGLVLIVLALVLVNKTRDFPGAWALLPVLGAVLLIACAPGSWIGRRLLSNRVMVWFGLISFPLYLWHWPLLAFLRIVKGGELDGQLLLAAVGLAIVLAWLTYRLIEAPVRHLPGWRTVAALVLICVVVGGQGWSTFNREGMPFRLKDAQAKEEAGAMAWPSHLSGSEACGDGVPEHLVGRCLIADVTRVPDVALIGDSHANHYYWGLSRELASMNLNLLQFAAEGCPLLFDYDLLQGGESQGCRAVAMSAFQHVLDTSSIHTVILAGRWVAAMTGVQLAGRSDVGRNIVAVGRDGVSVSLSRAEVLIEAVDRTLSVLQAAGKRVIFLDSVPELDFNIRECIAWEPNRFVKRIPRTECEVSRERIEVRAEQYRPALYHVLERHPAVSVIDPVGYMCDARACYGRRDGVLLYRDDDHLSLGGSYWVAGQLRDAFAAALLRPLATVPAVAGGGEG